MKQGIDVVLGPAYREDLSPTIPNCGDDKAFAAPPEDDRPTVPTSMVAAPWERGFEPPSAPPPSFAKAPPEGEPTFTLPPFHALSLCAPLAEPLKPVPASQPGESEHHRHLEHYHQDPTTPLDGMAFAYHCKLSPPSPIHKTVTSHDPTGVPNGSRDETPSHDIQTADSPPQRDLPLRTLFPSTSHDENKMPPSRANFKRRRREGSVVNGSDSSFDRSAFLTQSADGDTPVKTRKRRRIANRNRALVAQDFDQILTEINASPSFL